MLSANFEANNGTLREDYKESLVRGVKKYYFVLKLFGAWLLIMSLFSAAGLIRSYIFDETFNDGLFQFLPIKLTALAISMLAVFGIAIGGGKLLATTLRIQKAAEQGDFSWKTGHLTNKERVVRGRATTSTYLYVDGEKCIPIELSYAEFEAAALGDEFIIIQLNKKSVTFALKP